MSEYELAFGNNDKSCIKSERSNPIMQHAIYSALTTSGGDYYLITSDEIKNILYPLECQIERMIPTYKDETIELNNSNYRILMLSLDIPEGKIVDTGGRKTGFLHITTIDNNKITKPVNKRVIEESIKECYLNNFDKYKYNDDNFKSAVIDCLWTIKAVAKKEDENNLKIKAFLKSLNLINV